MKGLEPSTFCMATTVDPRIVTCSLAVTTSYARSLRSADGERVDGATHAAAHRQRAGRE